MYIKPAYGRSYLTQTDARKDWNDGKDFYIVNGESSGRYMSIRDVKFIAECINLRWDNSEPVIELKGEDFPDPYLDGL